MEEWRDVEGTYGKIEVSNRGRIRSFLRDTPYVLKVQEDNKGYCRCSITIHGKKRTLKVHREVAIAFIDNPSNLPQVNHIDGNKKNNDVSNLEWVTNKENSKHAIKNGLWDSVFEGAKRENERRKKRIVAINRNDSTERISFGSIAEAERYFGSRHICDVLKGKREHAKGYRFEYEDAKPFIKGVMP